MPVNTDRTSRTLDHLNPRLNKAIAAYATAASALGVALAAAQPAQAEVVYTKTHATISRELPRYHLDLNNDHIDDFSIGFCSCIPHGTALTVWSVRGRPSGVMERSGFADAAALPSGHPIGPKQAFQTANTLLNVVMVLSGSYLGYPYASGSWLGASDRYLGLRFQIDGEVHYGWARMTVGKGLSHIVLTGYAYETIPNRPIKAGQTSETAENDAMNPDISALPVQGASLGMLARGAEAMEIWRREEEVRVV